MRPGYYAVNLTDADTETEVTVCGSHTAVYRFTYRDSPASGAGNYVVFDLSTALAAVSFEVPFSRFEVPFAAG